jgi:HlyD family secretion protein
VLAVLVWAIFGTVVTTVTGNGIVTNDKGGMKVIAAQQAGMVEAVLKQPGEAVRAGDPVLRLLTDGQPSEVASLVDGVIVEMRTTEGEFIPQGATVSTVTSHSADFTVIAFLPAADGKRVVPGMEVEIVPSTVSEEEYGSMSGVVTSVSERPVSGMEVETLLQDEELAVLLTHAEPPILVYVNLFEDATVPSGFRWHAGTGPSFAVTSGTLATIDVIVAEQAPITLILPNLKAILGR